MSLQKGEEVALGLEEGQLVPGQGGRGQTVQGAEAGLEGGPAPPQWGQG